MNFVLQFCTALVFLVFDSSNENEETLESQNPTNIATDMHEPIKPSQYYACKTKGNVTMVFLVFDSNNEIEETLKDQKLTKIASDMHVLISSNQYCAYKTKGSGCNSIGIKRLYQDIQKGKNLNSNV